MVRMSRKWAMPSGNTFSIQPIGELVKGVCKGAEVIVDPFANSSTWGTVRNDMNPEYGTEYCMDALEFLKILESDSADVVLYDPPYSITQAAELYASYGKDRLEESVSNMRYWRRCKDECARVLKVGGRCLCCGWNSNGLGKGRGFEMEELLVVAHGGSKNDTIVTVERKEWYQPKLPLA